MAIRKISDADYEVVIRFPRMAEELDVDARGNSFTIGLQDLLGIMPSNVAYEAKPINDENAYEDNEVAIISRAPMTTSI